MGGKGKTAVVGMEVGNGNGKKEASFFGEWGYS